MGNASKMSTIEKRKRLSALYEKGKIVRFGPNGVDGEPTDDDIEIFVGPPSPLHREMAIRDAQAERSRAILAVRKESNSEEYLSSASFIANMDEEAILEYVLSFGDSERQGEARRMVLARKEWDDFNSLRDSMRMFEEAGSPYEDPEWKFLLDRDRQFGEDVEKVLVDIVEGAREGLKLMGREHLEKRAMDRRIDSVGSAAFMKKYEESMLFWACKDPEDHNVPFFESIKEMRSQAEEVTDALQKTLATFITEAAEAKNSPAVGSGSTSSATPNEPEISPPSSPEESIGF